MTFLVSIIIPIYNCKKYLKQCLDSVINQTYSNIEVILVDDGSDDGSGEICDEYRYKDTRVKVIHKYNTGVSDTRNKGYEMSTGEYILFVDSDDYIEKNMVEELVDVAIRENVDVVRCKAMSFDIRGNIEEEKLYSYANCKLTGDEIKKCYSNFLTIKDSIACYSWLLLIKRDKYVRYDCNLVFMEDTEFYVRLFKKIDSVYFLDKALYWYRYNAESLTKNPEKGIENVHNMLNSIEIIKKNIVDILTEEFERDINSKLINLMFVKVKLYVKHTGFWESKKKLRELFNEEKVSKVVNFINIDKLSKIKKIQLWLIKHKLYSLLTVVVKITNIKS